MLAAAGRFACAALALQLAAAGLARADEREVELAREVARILEARCAECHVPESTDPKARKHDFARDLPKAVEDYVMPGDLTLSDLWYQVESGEMPPADAASGPLSVGEKEVVRSWILAGAPLPPVADTAAPAAEQPPAPPERLDRRALDLAGRMHPLFVHFPIAFLIGAGLLEILIALRTRAGLTTTAVVLVRLAALFAPLAAASGWINALDSAKPEELERHRWAGVTTLALSILLLVASEIAARGGSRLAYRVLLTLACAAVAVTGYLGGEIVYGAGYLLP